MGWAIGYDEYWKRDIGYGVPAICDHPECDRDIDRGLSYVCGGQPFGGDKGCGLFFCSEHLFYHEDEPNQLCEQCMNSLPAFGTKPDTKEWIDHKLTDPSWAEWRAEHPSFVKRYTKPTVNTYLLYALVVCLFAWMAVAIIVEIPK